MAKMNLDVLWARHHFPSPRNFTLPSGTAMRPLRRFIVPCVLITASACGNPRAEANTAQALNDAANEIGGLKNDVAQLQSDVDSLRQIVARQDSAITRIIAGIPK